MPRRGPRSRHWCVPPAVLRGPDETLEGAAILDEVPRDLGLLLWRTAGEVRLWGAAPRDARENLFVCDEEGRYKRLSTLAVTDIPAAISAQIDTLQSMFVVSARADACVLVAAVPSRAEAPSPLRRSPMLLGEPPNPPPSGERTRVRDSDSWELAGAGRAHPLAASRCSRDRS